LGINDNIIITITIINFLYLRYLWFWIRFLFLSTQKLYYCCCRLNIFEIDLKLINLFKKWGTYLYVFLFEQYFSKNIANVLLSSPRVLMCLIKIIQISFKGKSKPKNQSSPIFTERQYKSSTAWSKRNHHFLRKITKKISVE
jgi:hypothetical protein